MHPHSRQRLIFNNGYGVAIGVDVDVLGNRANVAFGRVIYDRSEQDDLVRKVLDVFRAPINSAKFDTPRLKRLVGTLTLYFVMLRAVLKDPAYYAEHEYRLFDALPRDPAEHSTSLQTFPRDGLNVSYFPVDLRASKSPNATQPIREVRIGPCLDFSTASECLLATSAAKAFQFPVIASRVPMRRRPPA